MPDTATIAIPKDLLPADGRFGSGPARIQTSFVHDLAATGSKFLGTSHRRTTVREIVKSIQTGIGEMYGLPDGYEVVLGVGGATAFWDIAGFGLIERRSAHFTCGEFSQKFADAVHGTPHLDTPVVVHADVGNAPEPAAITGTDTSAFIHNETSTGVLAPFRRFGDELVVVDGTSAAGAIPYDVSHVDAYYFSPQKALGSDGGLWLATLSPRAISRAESIRSAGRWIPPSLSLTTAIKNSRLAQTYNTPALATLYLLAAQITYVNDRGGLVWTQSVTEQSSAHLYQWAELSEYAQPFVQKHSLRSPTIVTIDFDGTVSADDVAGVLRANRIVDTESYRKLGRNQLRIATFPNVPVDDVQALTECIDYVAERL
ncbi:MAG: phosphoserine transaminase [Acidobacteria bacterium]|nr:MAG: phosphoserine transaminase [Acidobacteriota bacterium]